MTLHEITRASTKKSSLVCFSVFSWIVTRLLLVVFVSGAFAQSQADELPGLAELKKGDYETAIKIFSARLVTNPGDAEAEKYLLRAYR